MSTLGFGSLEAALAMGQRVRETTGKVVTVKSDGKLFTVELPPLTAAEYDELRGRAAPTEAELRRRTGRR